MLRTGGREKGRGCQGGGCGQVGVEWAGPVWEVLGELKWVGGEGADWGKERGLKGGLLEVCSLEGVVSVVLCGC